MVQTLVQADAEEVIQAVVKLVFLGMITTVCLMYVFMLLVWIHERIEDLLARRRWAAQEKRRKREGRDERIRELERELGMLLEPSDSPGMSGH